MHFDTENVLGLVNKKPRYNAGCLTEASFLLLLEGVPEVIQTPDLSLRRSLKGAFLIPLKSSKILDFTGFSEILVLIISLMKSANFTPFFSLHFIVRRVMLAVIQETAQSRMTWQKLWRK